MHETQKTISEWATKTFGYPTVRRSLERMLEEVEEIEQLVTYSSEDNKVHCSEQYLEKIHESIADECADMHITMCQVMNVMGYDLHSCVDHKMEINRARKWKLNEDGTGQHIKE